MDGFVKTFGINLGLLIGYTLDFLIVLYVLNRYLYKPILKLIDTRKKEIETSAKLASDLELRTKKMQEEYEKSIKKAQVESNTIIQSAKEIGTKLQEKMKTDAEQQVIKLQTQIKRDLENEKHQMYESLKKDLSSLIVGVSEKVIKHDLSDKEHDAIIKESIKEFEETK